MAALLALAFTAFYAATTRGRLAFGDDLVYYQVTESIVGRGAIDVPPRPPRRGPGQTVPGAAGRFYSKYGLGLSLVAIPAYALGRLADDGRQRLAVTFDESGRARSGIRIFVTGLTNAVLGGLAVAALFWLALELGYGIASAAAVAAALGGATFFAHYATTFLSEPLSALLLTTAVTAALRTAARLAAGEARAATWTTAIGAAAAGLAIVTRVAHAPAIAAIGLWLGLRLLAPPGSFRGRGSRRLALRLLALWGCGVAAGGVAIAAYNAVRFGNPLETGYGRDAVRFTTPLLDGLGGLLVSPGRGVLWYAPPLLLAIPGWWLLARRRPAAAALLATVCLAVLVVSATFYMWWGGGSWGPRFLVPILPLALVPAAELKLRRAGFARWLRPAAALVLAAGVLVAVLPALVPIESHAWRPTRVEVRAQRHATERRFWLLNASPLVSMAREAPGAAARTARLLAGSESLFRPGSAADGLPDVAFATYRSAALLLWTRCWLAVAGVAGAATVWTLRRRARSDRGRAASGEPAPAPPLS